MPLNLRKAHQENDKAVMQAYGFDSKILSDDNEASIVAELFKLYQALVEQKSWYKPMLWIDTTSLQADGFT